MLISTGYENHLGRLQLVVATDSVRAYLRDSRILRFGHDLRELENFLRYQVRAIRVLLRAKQDAVGRETCQVVL